MVKQSPDKPAPTKRPGKFGRIGFLDDCLASLGMARDKGVMIVNPELKDLTRLS
jgi:hypothetical protein